MDNMIPTIVGGVIGIVGGVVGSGVAQYFIYLKELKFKRMDRLEVVLTDLYGISHGLHSAKRGDFSKIPDSIITKKCFDVGRIYFPKKIATLDKLDALFDNCCISILEKEAECFEKSLSEFDIEITSMIKG